MEQGTLQRNNKEFFLTIEGENFAIHSTVDAPKVLKLEIGSPIYGLIRRYSRKELQQLGWKHHGTVETGHLRVGVMPCT
jgi:hypothetical protein